MCRFGIDFDEGEKLAGKLRVKTKDPRGTSINDFSIPDIIICTLKSHVYEICCFLLCAFEICKVFSNRSHSQVVNGNKICVGYGRWAACGGGGSTLIKNFASVLHTLNRSTT